MRRAAVSISSNLAEGSSRASRADFARYVEIAVGSLYEVVSQARVAERLEMLSTSEATELQEEAERLARRLTGLRRLDPNFVG